MAQSKRLEAQNGRYGAAAMTVRKTDNLLRGDRTPAYVGREIGAAELQISPDTWDQWVKEGASRPRVTHSRQGQPAGAGKT